MASSLTDVSIDALDTRLRRLEYAITGSLSSGKDGSAKTTLEGGSIPGHITALNERLARLANQSKHLRRLLHACDTDTILLSEPAKSPPPTDLTQPEKLAIILPSAPTYHQTSSLLLALRDTPFPEESISAEVANVLPEVVDLQLRVAEKENRVKELVGRSLQLLQGWYGVVEGFNGCVAEWDNRLREAETGIIRRERAMRETEEY